MIPEIYIYIFFFFSLLRTKLTYDYVLIKSKCFYNFLSSQAELNFKPLKKHFQSLPAPREVPFLALAPKILVVLSRNEPDRSGGRFIRTKSIATKTDKAGKAFVIVIVTKKEEEVVGEVVIASCPCILTDKKKIKIKIKMIHRQVYLVTVTYVQ